MTYKVFVYWTSTSYSPRFGQFDTQVVNIKITCKSLSCFLNGNKLLHVLKHQAKLITSYN